MRTEIASLGEFGLIDRLTGKMNLANMEWATMLPFSPTLPKSRC